MFPLTRPVRQMLATGALLNVVAESARLRKLHFGNKLGAPNGFFECVRQTIAIAVVSSEVPWGRIERL